MQNTRFLTKVSVSVTVSVLWHTKSTVFDLVTDTDRKVEDFIVSELKKRFPDYGIYGEESGKSHAEREYCFVIDPIDGTSS